MYEKAIKINPKFVASYNNKGLYFYKMIAISLINLYQYE